MKTIFVTGASSSMGRQVVEKLCGDHRILALLHRTPLGIAGDNIEAVNGDLLDPSSYAAFVSQADMVLHMAGLTHSQQEAAYEKINHEGTARLLSVCRAHQRFIYISSRCVGAAGGAYSHSKAKAESAISASGLRYTIVRPSEIYGSKLTEGIDALLRLALRYRVVIDFRWHGPVTYSPISVQEFSDLLERMVRREVRERAVYEVCNQSEYRAEDIRRTLLAAGRAPCFLWPVPVRLLKFLQALRMPLPFKKDQLARLVMKKSNDASLVRSDYAFAPQDYLAFVWEQGRCVAAQQKQ